MAGETRRPNQPAVGGPGGTGSWRDPVSLAQAVRRGQWSEHGAKEVISQAYWPLDKGVAGKKDSGLASVRGNVLLVQAPPSNATPSGLAWHGVAREGGGRRGARRTSRPRALPGQDGGPVTRHPDQPRPAYMPDKEADRALLEKMAWEVGAALSRPRTYRQVRTINTKRAPEPRTRPTWGAGKHALAGKNIRSTQYGKGQ